MRNETSIDWRKIGRVVEQETPRGMKFIAFIDCIGMRTHPVFDTPEEAAEELVKFANRIYRKLKSMFEPEKNQNNEINHPDLRLRQIIQKVGDGIFQSERVPFEVVFSVYGDKISIVGDEIGILKDDRIVVYLAAEECVRIRPDQLVSIEKLKQK